MSADEFGPSQAFVVHVLEESGPMTRAELLEDTPLAERTLDRALRRLREDGVVERSSDPSDLRYRLYTRD